MWNFQMPRMSHNDVGPCYLMRRENISRCLISTESIDQFIIPCHMFTLECPEGTRAISWQAYIVHVYMCSFIVCTLVFGHGHTVWYSNKKVTKSLSHQPGDYFPTGNIIKHLFLIPFTVTPFHILLASNNIDPCHSFDGIGINPTCFSP